MKPIRAEMMGGRVRAAERIETQTNRRRASAPPSRSPVISGVESEADWLDHRADVIRGLAPHGSEDEALAEDIARVLWRQRRALRLTTHLRSVVARERAAGSVTGVAFQENATRLAKLEALCADLDRRLLAAYERYSAAKSTQPREAISNDVPLHSGGKSGIRRAVRPRRSNPSQDRR